MSVYNVVFNKPTEGLDEVDHPFPAYKGDSQYVFVSYSHGDSSSVYPELVWLKESGFNIWYDEGIEAGTEWTEALARLAGLAAPSSVTTGGGHDLATAAVAMLRDLGWSERASVLLATEDLPALLRDPDTDGLDTEQRRALAYLAWVEAIRPLPGGGLHARDPVSGARLAPTLVRIGESYKAFGRHKGTIAAVGQGSVRLVRGKGSVRLPVADDVALFGRTGGKSVPTSRLALWPGDLVRYRTNGAGAIDLLELQPPVWRCDPDKAV